MYGVQYIFLIGTLIFRLEWINMREKLRRKVGNYYGATVGDRLRIMCSSEGSFPAASLRFYINDEIANDQNVRTINNHHKMKGIIDIF